MKYVPNIQELSIIKEITTIHQEEYAVVRLTPTMLQKAIIDASALIRSIFKQDNIIDYKDVTRGPEGKLILEVTILTDEVHARKASFYRPLTKKGDPRFWIYGLKDFIKEGEMIFLTVFEGRLIIIPLVERSFNKDTVTKYFGGSETESIKNELTELLTQLNRRGPVKSVSPFTKYHKDVGDTLERELGILPNSLKLADFRSSIELKAKRNGKVTKDTLFSMVPNWMESKIPSSNQMIQTYGYPSKKYEDYLDLFVTVSNKPNNQGLYLEVDEEQNLLYQYHIDQYGMRTETAVWDLETINKRLVAKHPETAWVNAEELIIGGEIYFHYNKAVYTRTPLFSSFLVLISQGIITYDWRGRVKKDGTGYKDKGHCFRIKPKFRNILFNEIEAMDI